MSTLDHILATELTPKKIRIKEGQKWKAVKPDPRSKNLAPQGTWSVDMVGDIETTGDHHTTMWIPSELIRISNKLLRENWELIK